MDSYTDVSGQCCGQSRGHGSCSPSCNQTCNQTCNSNCKNTCSPCWCHDYPDMNTVPWASNDGSIAPSYSYEDTMYSDRSCMDCVSTEPGCLEQRFPAAMAYVPWQQWQTPYVPERALAQGTIFPDLDLQFIYGRCGR